MRMDDGFSNACRLQGSLEHEDACPKGDVDSLSPHGPSNAGLLSVTFGGAAPLNVADFFRRTSEAVSLMLGVNRPSAFFRPSFDVALTRGEVGFAGYHGLPGSLSRLVRTPNLVGVWGASAGAAHPLPESRLLFLPTLLLQPQDVPFAAVLPLEQEVHFLLQLEAHFFRRS